jgi:hypothetical protein
VKPLAGSAENIRALEVREELGCASSTRNQNYFRDPDVSRLATFLLPLPRPKIAARIESKRNCCF